MKNEKLFLVILVSLFILTSIVSVKAETVDQECYSLLNVLVASKSTECGDTGYDGYDKRADFNNDRKIDSKDQALLSANYNSESWCKNQMEKEFDPCDIPSNIGSYATNLLAKMTEAYNTKCGDSNYNKIADIDNSKKIDFDDLGIFAMNAEDESWCNTQLQKRWNPCDIPDNIGPYATKFLEILTNSYRAKCGDLNYNKIADIDNSKEIGFDDLGIFAMNAEDESWCNEQLQKTFDPCNPTIECTDTDNGKNYYVKGEIQGELVSGLGSSSVDLCFEDGIKLRELFCNSDGKGEPIIYECPNGCSNGACVKGREPYCSVIGTESEGWYQNDKLVKWDNCEGCIAVCKYPNSKSEGWYNSCTNSLIKWDDCDGSNISVGCVKEGEKGSMFDGDPNNDVCCDELVKVRDAYPYNYPNGGCSISKSGFVCTKCGNGECGEGENECNCPEDCEECRDEEYGCTLEFLPCCNGLKEVPLAFEENGQCIAASCGSICRPCGNGICDENENKCNCPEDCEEKCVGEGGIVKSPFEGIEKVCCEGLHEIGSGYRNAVAYCTSEVCGDGKCKSVENKYNCPEDCEEKECIGEGKWGNFGDECCEGLKNVGNWAPMSNGECTNYRNPSFKCTKCGNGRCGLGEDYCNCREDCTVPGIPDYVDVEIKPDVRTINYGQYARYTITVKDKHENICPVGSTCASQSYTYRIDVNNLPFLKEYKRQVTLSAGGKTFFTLTVKPYQMVAIGKPIEEREVTVEKEEIPQITEQGCDINNHCPEGLDCFSFPGIGLRCAELKPCTYYKCPEGTECLVQETYPSSVVCSCVGPECTATSSGEDTISSEYTTAAKVQKITANVVVGTGVTGRVVEEMVVEENPQLIHSYYAKRYKFNVKATLSGNSGVYDRDYAELIIKPEVFIDPPDFPTEEVTIKLYKGWNLISLPGKLVQFSDNGCTSNRKLLGFVYIKEQQKYVTLQQAQSILRDNFAEYLAKNAFWIYSYENCNLRARLDMKVSYSGINLYEGWNLVPITEDMVGGYLSDMTSECSVEKIYKWNPQIQNWKKITTDYIFLNTETYYGFITKVNNNCVLGGVSILEISEIMEEE